MGVETHGRVLPLAPFENESQIARLHPSLSTVRKDSTYSYSAFFALFEFTSFFFLSLCTSSPIEGYKPGKKHNNYS